VWAVLNSKTGKPKHISQMYKNYLLMQHMGWTWGELMNTPCTVAADCWRYMQTEISYHNQKK